MSMSERVLAEGFIEIQQKCECKKKEQCLYWFNQGYEKVICNEQECPKMPYIKGR